MKLDPMVSNLVMKLLALVQNALSPIFYLTSVTKKCIRILKDEWMQSIFKGVAEFGKCTDTHYFFFKPARHPVKINRIRERDDRHKNEKTQTPIMME